MVTSKRSLLVLKTALLIPLFFTANIVLADPTIRLSGQTAVVDGVTPGANVVWMMTGIESEGYYPLLLRSTRLIPDDNLDGSVQFDYGREIPKFSLWFAVDLSTGKFGSAFADGFTPQAMIVPTDALRTGFAGTLSAVDIRRDYLEVLVVRPGLGAWSTRISEGGSKDADGQLNFTISIAPSMLNRVTSADAPSVFLPGDLVVMVDPHNLSYVAAPISR